MTDHRPSFLLRLCIVAGGAAFLLGLVGAGMILVRGDGTPDATGPGHAPVLVLDGAAARPHLHVEVSWTDGSGRAAHAARRLGPRTDRWLLPEPPPVPVDLVVREGPSADAPSVLEARLLPPWEREIRLRLDPDARAPAARSPGSPDELDEAAPNGR